jgi:hypothetical protein
LLLVDAYPGARPLPAFSHKVELPLAAHLERDNTLSKLGEERLTEVVAEALPSATRATATMCSPGYRSGPGRTSGCCPARTRRG